MTFIESGKTPIRRAWTVVSAKRLAVIGGVIVALLLLRDTVFSVDQTELGNVRRFGTVLYPPGQPLEPGLHFKLPLIDTADTLRVTLQTLHIPAFDVLTVDNQRVSIEENFNYNISKAEAYHVMYEVGRPGNIDIEDQVIPVARDRTARVFAGRNMVAVNAEREAIQALIEKSVTESVEQLFGITAHSLQISAIRPSEKFMESIDQATTAKNGAIAAENQLRTKQFEAEQVAATAKGAADAAIEQARGQAESTKLNAEARKSQLELEGEGLEANLGDQIKPFGSADKYIQYLNAKALLNWNGQQPQIVTGSGSGTSLVVPVPGLNAKP